MLPNKCIQEPCRNMEVNRWKTWRPGSVRQASLSPMGNRVPTGSESVNSPGIRPSSQTDLDTDKVEPAPCTKIQTNTFRMMIAAVTMAGRWVSFSSR